MQLSRQHLVLVWLVLVSLLGLTWYSVWHLKTAKAEKSPIQSSLDSLRQAREKQQKLENEISRGVWEKCYTESLTLSGKVFDEQQWIAYQCWTSEKQKLIYWTGNLTPSSEVPIRWIITKVSAAELTTVPRAVASESRQVKSEKQSPSVSPKSTPAQTVAPISHIESLKKIGYREEPTRALITACNKARDPLHCKLYWLSIMYNEAGNQQKSKACVTRKNCMGLKSGKMVFKSYQDGMDDWVRRYNRYWHKATSMSQFYAPKGKRSYYGYCDRDVSNGPLWCPEWLKITSTKFTRLSLIFKK